MIISLMAALLIAMPPLFDSSGVEVKLPLNSGSILKNKVGLVAYDQAAEIFFVGLFNPETKKIGAPMFGSYKVRNGVLVFTPSQPFSAGNTYRAYLTNSSSPFSEFKIAPATIQDQVKVVRIYPSGNQVPANLLKFTILFSGPMRQSKAIFDAIELLGPDGKPIDDPWRRTELWNDNDTRLTLWFHPGRVKLGVNLREQLGPPLEPGKAYTLKISKKFLDASGNELTADFEKKILAGPEVRARIDAGKWKIVSPTPDSKEPLSLLFNFPIDPFLFSREVEIFGPTGRKILGKSLMFKDEKSWTLVPEQAWQQGDYVIHVGGEVADLAGNTISRPFEVNLEALEPLQTMQKLRFTVK